MFHFIMRHREKKAMPMAANYEITSHCNLKCQHCYLSNSCLLLKELDEQEWEKAFLRHKENGVNGAHLTGGEPFLRPEIVRLAHNIFNNLSIVTNGTIAIPDDIQRRIFVSIDGPEEIHDQIRGANVYAKIMQHIYNDKRVILTPTLSTLNYTCIDDLIEITKESKVEGITFSTYASHCAVDDPLILKEEHLDFIVAKLLEVWKKNKDIVFLTPCIIKLFKTKKHIDNCYFRGKAFISFDAGLHIKQPCVMGEKIDCSTCGCIVPMVSYALRHGDIRSWFLFDRLFPERYSSPHQKGAT
jgi:MoaA/NifB/PqqE/SkfB family radical SAM enzyme